MDEKKKQMLYQPEKCVFSQLLYITEGTVWVNVIHGILLLSFDHRMMTVFRKFGNLE
ncbi:hypothetical protein KIN20_005548 [Parelaphostrongylus tenuis]|uniref:Uncharacterized protein n=1 Tax=Parelaphostrongylus tenuis TaxID=148309 RepID=A0AAD5M4Q3_PARTN|nr:hypothetical protein KIN20_005548 [Parelaphostrongylus tenuis]